MPPSGVVTDRSAGNADSIIGQPMDRTDGRLKVTGGATYTADNSMAGVAHGVIVSATVAKGRIRHIDATRAEAAPGVVKVITHRNAMKLTQPKIDFNGGGYPAEMQMPLADDSVVYAGQAVALVVGETIEQARHAAALIAVDYEAERPVLDRKAAEKDATYPEQSFGEPLQVRRGDVEAALANAAAKIDGTYITPIETHNPMELSATVALWSGDELIVYDATQWVMGTQATLAEAFGMPREKVRVICPFVGGGFGCKGFQWPHTFIAAVAAKMVNRPVKIYLARRQMFTNTGHRPRTEQQITLAADAEGKLTAIRHKVTSDTSFVADFVEACALATSSFLYACPNVDLPQKVLRLNLPTPTPMRAPGECPGSFALECAMDELAYALKMDPVQLRIINHADTDPKTGLPYSSKHLKECYEIAAQQFGWAKRSAAPRSMRGADGRLIGWGMATATYPGYMFPASARVRLLPDGRAVVASATHDLGTGAWTIFTQVAAAALGLPVEKVKFQLGDSRLPPAPVAGGSNSTASVSEAILKAAEKLRARLRKIALVDANSPLKGVPADRVVFQDGRLVDRDDPARGHSLAELILRAQPADLEAVASNGAGEEQKKYSFHSFGCHFVEVMIDEPIGRCRVTRVFSAIDNGRVINHKTARSQVIGGVTMGLGMALMEATEYGADGRPINDNLADYAVCVNADVPQIGVHLLDKPDPHINALGCRGIGEIAIVGVAAAVANAIFHATGKRLRELPITSDKLMATA
ncbi:MAG: xanthine dehydrogenase family protein molybdopterin-binding subunit [Phycisphaerae bacterium]